MIPKKIHYCWFGGNEKPKSIQKCINSWKKFCPDYEIIEWNESNFDIHCMPFVEQAYEAKKYAFVTDVARLMLVYQYGGIYMDTDVEVIKPPDDLLENKAYMGFENNENVATGLGFGSEAGLPFLKEHIDVYKEWNFINEDGTYNQIGAPKATTDLFKTKGIVLDGNEQTVCDVHIYPAEYFNPYDNIIGKLNKTDKTYSIHWYDASWIDKSAKQLKFNRFVRRIIGKENVEKLKRLREML